MTILNVIVVSNLGPNEISIEFFSFPELKLQAGFEKGECLNSRELYGFDVGRCLASSHPMLSGA